MNPRGLIGWGARDVSLALSPFLLLCFKARMGPSAPFPSLHRSGLNHHFASFPVLKRVHLCLPLCHLSFPSLFCSASVKSERGFQNAGSAQMEWKGPVGPVGQTWACWARSVCGWRWLLREGLRSVVGAHRVLSSTWLGGMCEDVCTWEIMKKIQHCVPQKVEFAAHGRQARLVLWVVLEEYELSWFSQNEEAPQCPHGNYVEKLIMQIFERKEGRKKKERK